MRKSSAVIIYWLLKSNHRDTFYTRGIHSNHNIFIPYCPFLKYISTCLSKTIKIIMTQQFHFLLAQMIDGNDYLELTLFLDLQYFNVITIIITIIITTINSITGIIVTVLIIAVGPLKVISGVSDK